MNDAGRIVYEAFTLHRGVLPDWDSLPEDIREAWRAAARAAFDDAYHSSLLHDTDPPPPPAAA